MADPVYTNAPQVFSFTPIGGQSIKLTGQLVGWSGATPRKFATHSFPKRDGALKEDMGRGPRRLDVRLEFITERSSSGTITTAAQLFQRFLASVQQPFGLLNHPIVGQWQAFCEGPREDVDFNRSTNSIHVTVTWEETALDTRVPKDVPSSQAAAQATTTKISAMEQAVASFIGKTAELQTKTAQGVARIQNAVATAATLASAPVQFVHDEITTVSGLKQSILASINAVVVATDVLSADIRAFTDAASSTNSFTGFEVVAGVVQSVDTLLGTVLTSSAELELALIAASFTPAGAAEAVGQKDEAAASCLILAEAIKAEKPTLISVTTDSITDVVSIALKLYPGDNATSRAVEILSLNRIQNPAAIPPGTVLQVYSK